MGIHKYARSCPASRALLVRRVLEEGWSLRAAAEAAGLSERTAYKWLARYRKAGLAGLEDRSSSPRKFGPKGIQFLDGICKRRGNLHESGQNHGQEVDSKGLHGSQVQILMTGAVRVSVLEDTVIR